MTTLSSNTQQFNIVNVTKLQQAVPHLVNMNEIELVYELYALIENKMVIRDHKNNRLIAELLVVIKDLLIEKLTGTENEQ